MNTRKKIIAIFAVVLFWSCGNKTIDNGASEVIKINPNTAEEYINLSEIVDSVKCIKLQTDSNDVMGKVRDIIIKKKYIYAIDISQKIIFVFDKTGKFVVKLDKRGQGPDEYVYMGPIFIDDNEEYIEVINFQGEKTTILKYANVSFELLEVLPFPDLNFDEFRRRNNFYYLVTNQIDNKIKGKQTNAGLVIVDDKNDTKTLFNKNIETNHNYFSFNIKRFTENDSNELFVSLMFDNTFYRLDAEEAHPVIGVDFGKYGMDNATGLKSTEKQMEYIKQKNGLAFFPILNINNSDIMSFSYYFKQDSEERFPQEKDIRQYIKIKQSNKVYHVKKIKNDITNFPDYIYFNSFYCAHEVWYEDYLIDIVVPNYYFPNNETEKIFVNGIGEITGDDDPIVVMMKLKKAI